MTNLAAHGDVAHSRSSLGRTTWRLDVAGGLVPLPDALDRKYPNASGERRWQWMLRQKHPRKNCWRSEQERHHVDESIVPKAFKRAIEKARMSSFDSAKLVSLPKAFKQAVEKAGLTTRATCHTLRHSLGMHLIEAGYGTGTVQELLGHKGVRMTMIYTHVLNRGGKGVRSPVDTLYPECNGVLCGNHITLRRSWKTR